LSNLVDQLEKQKQKLPKEDHAIIEWGINAVKAKIREEEIFTRELEKEWKQKFGARLSMSEFDSVLERFDPRSPEDKKKLCRLCVNQFADALRRSIDENYIRAYEIETLVNLTKTDLRNSCQARGMGFLYTEMIKDCRETFRNEMLNGRNKSHNRYYEKLISLLS